MKLYPVVIHKDPHSVFGVIVPDLPGCFSAGNTLDEAIRNVQEAVEVHLHGEELAPEPSPLDRWKADPEYQDAYAVALAPVDLSFLNDATVRVNITAKKSELAVVDRAAKRAHMDRSGFLIVSAIERAREALKAPAAVTSSSKDLTGRRVAKADAFASAKSPSSAAKKSKMTETGLAKKGPTTTVRRLAKSKDRRAD